MKSVILSEIIGGAKELLKHACSLIMILSQYEDNVMELGEEITKLIDNRMSVERDVNSAKLEGKTPKPQVNEWLVKASQAEDDVTPLLEMPVSMMNQYRQCCIVAKKLDLLKELNSTRFENVARENSSPINSVVEMSVLPLVGEGAASNMKRLLEILNRDDFRRIGVCGESGIGKTTLIMNLNNELRISSPNSFDIVIWVQVSTPLDVRTIQSQIAKRIRLKVEADDTTISIASGILERLKLRRKILLILDDVCEKIDLDAVGIPSNDACCKVLLTTRSLEVCSQMAVDSLFRLNVMNVEDAWELFVDSVGPVVHLDGIETLARKMAANCHGLPLAIKTLGNFMRGVSLIGSWQNANRRWGCSSYFFNNIEQEIFQCLALSYHSLQDNILKQCFLYCSLYPESLSINVEELIQCWVSDGLLITENQTVEETFYDGLYLIERLKNLCLLYHDATEGTVKMPVHFRELALRLSQREELFGFQSQANSPSYQMPNKSSKRVSLISCRITELLAFPVCSMLTVLFLQDNPIKNIQNEFFHNLKHLRVLNLSRTRITCLPSSILCLRELRSLFLRGSSITTLPSLKSLGKLLVLDLSETQIKALPEGLGCLHSLREFDLSCTHFLEDIIAGSFSGLSSLESLNMSCSAFKWNSKADRAAAQSATFEELLSLDRLSALQIRLDSFRFLKNASCFLKKLTKLHIQIRPWTHHSQKDLQHRKRSLDMLAFVGMSQRHWLNLSSLISLNLSHCDAITHLISNERSYTEIFPNLQHIVLDHLQNLETIVEEIIPGDACLVNLKTIQALDCPMLKGVISYAMLPRVKKLEEIKVSGCKNMSYIICSGEHEETLPNLRVIEMNNMVNLRSICYGTLVYPALLRIDVSCCPKMKELPLSISKLPSIKEIRGESRWWNTLIWENNGAKEILQQYFQACQRVNCSRKRKYKFKTSTNLGRSCSKVPRKSIR